MATNENYYTILTSYGKQALANAQASGTAVNITEFAVGDGNGSYYAPNETQTALVNEVYRAQVNRITTDSANPNWVIVEGIIPADVGGFTIREIGIFDDSGNLVAIGNYPETYKPVLSQGAGNDMYIRFIMEVENVDSVQLKIDPAIVLASRKYVDDEISTHNLDTTAHADIREILLNGTVNNADKIDNFHASAFQSLYSKMTVSTSFPSSANDGDMLWREDLQSLYRYDGIDWVEIDWRNIIKSTPEYQLGVLRENSASGMLEISPDGTNWFECIPVIGNTVKLETIDETNYSYLYFLLPGTTVIVENTGHIPIAYTPLSEPMYDGLFLCFQQGLAGSIGGLYPADIQISDGWYRYLHGNSSDTVITAQGTGKTYVPLIDTDQNGEMWGRLSIKITSQNVMYTEFLGQGSQGNVLILSGKGTAPSTSFWLGTLINSDGTKLTINKLSLTRRA